MATETEPDPGAPVPKDQLDPELIKLARKRPTVGLVTALGIVAIAVYFLVRLGPDRHFAGEGDKPAPAKIADVLAGNVSADSYISLAAEPLISQSTRATTTKGSLGLRVSPVRGTGDRLWLVEPGDAYGEPATEAYAGRLRKLADLPLASSVREFAVEHPRPVFATPAAIKAGAATNHVTTVTKDDVALADTDRVALDVVDPHAAVVVASFTDKLPDAGAWSAALAAAGLAPTASTPETDGVRFDIDAPDAVAFANGKLEAAQLWATRVDPVTRHVESTWGEVKKAPPDARVDLVGLYVAREVPSDAYALLVGEKPADYWYVTPVSIVLGLIALVFAWAAWIAFRRDLLAPKA